MLRIRLARRGRKNLNSFAIVAAEQQFRRDGRFVEKIGYYQPLLKDADPFRLHIDAARYEYWVSKGAQPTQKVQFLAAKNGIVQLEKKDFVLGKKAEPKAKAKKRLDEKEKEIAKAKEFEIEKAAQQEQVSE